MKLYLEAMEIRTEITEEDAEFIRIDITGMDEPTIDLVRESIKDIMSGIEYTFNRHECGHDEEKACIMIPEM